MFKLAVFSIILFVLSFSATAIDRSKRLPEGHFMCNMFHYFEHGYYRSPMSIKDEYVARQHTIMDGTYGPLQLNDAPSCTWNMTKNQDMFHTKSVIKHDNGNFTMKGGKYQWGECLYLELVHDCFKPGSTYSCILSLECGIERTNAVLTLSALLLVMVTIHIFIWYLNRKEKARQAGILTIEFSKSEEDESKLKIRIYRKP